MSAQREWLFGKYLALDDAQQSSPTHHFERSLRYFRAEQSLIHSAGAVNLPGSRISKWVLTARAFESFAREHGRLPMTRRRSSNCPASDAESRLAEWSKYQRRPAVHARLCAYQVERLECVAGFSWDPAGDRWDDQLFGYLDFVVTFGRKPRYRSVNPDERHLAGWEARQRHLIKRGLLSHSRMLEFHAATGALPIVWGTQVEVSSGSGTSERPFLIASSL